MMSKLKRSEFFEMIARARLAYSKDSARDLRAAIIAAGLPAPPVSDSLAEAQLWMHPMGAVVSSGIGAVATPDPFFFLGLSERAWEWYEDVWYPESIRAKAA